MKRQLLSFLLSLPLTFSFYSNVYAQNSTTNKALPSSIVTDSMTNRMCSRIQFLTVAKSLNNFDCNANSPLLYNFETTCNTEPNTENNTLEQSINEYKIALNTTQDIDIGKLSTATKGWGTSPRTDGSIPNYPKAISELLAKFSGYYVGDTSKKVLYITFDEGYENGYSSKILDILKENDVKAAFFVTVPYINSNPDLIKRMVAEGHLVCNHSTHHKSMPIFKEKTEFENELKGAEEAYEKVTGSKMPKFFRPPMGEYSELSLYYTSAMGYKSIFWSFAYVDFSTKKQPSIENAKKVILERTHNGAIYLLHAVSKTNTEVLDSVIKEWRNRGYEFKTLNDLPQ